MVTVAGEKFEIGDFIAVAADWEPPRDWKTGKLLPTFRRRLTPALRQEIEAEQKAWDEARDLWLIGKHPDQLNPAYGYNRYTNYENVSDRRPGFSEVLPNWSEEELTHIVAFSAISEVTISPLFASVEEAAKWTLNEWRKEGHDGTYTAALALVVRCVLRHEGPRFLEKLSENIDAWPAFDFREGRLEHAGQMNREIIMPYLEARKKHAN